MDHFDMSCVLLVKLSKSLLNSSKDKRHIRSLRHDVQNDFDNHFANVFFLHCRFLITTLYDKLVAGPSRI